MKTNYQTKNYPDESKCGYCNFWVQQKYAITGLDIDDAGLCADCFMEMVSEVSLPINPSLTSPQ
ncbi:MAG: hypothetical protein ACRDFC_07105 [Ignavibacteria bacterium]